MACDLSLLIVLLVFLADDYYFYIGKTMASTFFLGADILSKNEAFFFLGLLSCGITLSPSLGVEIPEKCSVCYCLISREINPPLYYFFFFFFFSFFLLVPIAFLLVIVSSTWNLVSLFSSLRKKAPNFLQPSPFFLSVWWSLRLVSTYSIAFLSSVLRPPWSKTDSTN